MPFQYLIASAHWHSYVLSVSPGVLIPRPETEIFVDLVRDALRRRPHLAAMPWADLGTGSGAIAIAAADVLRKHSKVRPRPLGLWLAGARTRVSWQASAAWLCVQASGSCMLLLGLRCPQPRPVEGQAFPL